MEDQYVVNFTMRGSVRIPARSTDEAQNKFVDDVLGLVVTEEVKGVAVTEMRVNKVGDPAVN